MILPNSIEYIECFLAAMLGGWVFNPLPYFIQIQELKKIFTYVEPNIIITDKKEIFSHLSKQYKILTPEQVLSGNKKFKQKEIDLQQPAALYYSSGTTDNPKGVMYSHKNMVSLINSIIRGFKFTSADRQLAFLPFGHTASINYNILPSLLIGCDLFISKGFEHLRSIFFNILEKYRITYTEIVPTVLFILNKLKVDISNIDLSLLEFIGCGSSTLPLSAQKEFITHYGVGIGNLYGLSETGPTHIDDPRKKGWKPGSIGIPLDVNKCRISEDGEILIKGENVFMSYYKNKQLYEKSVVDGWFHTGDLGKYNEGKFYFTDRKKDIIIKGSINIVPMEIEEVVHEHPAVLECVVVGKTDKIHGEDVAIVIVKNKSTLGIGSGQPSRLDSCKIAIEKMNKFRSNYFDNSVAASDAFFPFVDGIETLVQSGISAIIQPSGSIRDKEIIKFANQTNTILVFSNTRHFKH